MVTAQPDATVAELLHGLASRRSGVRVGATTVWRAVARLGLPLEQVNAYRRAAHAAGPRHAWGVRPQAEEGAAALAGVHGRDQGNHWDDPAERQAEECLSGCRRPSGG